MLGEVGGMLSILGLTGCGAVGIGLAARAASTYRAKDAPIDDLFSFGAWVDGDNCDGLWLTREGGVCGVLAIGGAQLSSMAEDDQARYRDIAATAMTTLLEAGAFLRLGAVREPVKLNFPASYPDPMLQAIHEAQQAKFAAGYVTRRYVVVSFPSGKQQAVCRDRIREAQDMFGILQARLLDRAQVRAWVGNRVDLVYGGVAGPGELVEAGRVSEWWADNATGTITVKAGAASAVSRVVSVREWGEDDSYTIVDGLLNIPGRVEVWFTVQGRSREIAPGELEHKLKTQYLGGISEEVTDQFENVSGLIQSRQDYLVNAHMFVVVSGPDAAAVEKLVGDVRAHLNEFRVKPLGELRGAAPLWVGRLPGPASDLVMRPRPMLISNVSSLNRFEYEPEGLESCDWGVGPLRVFLTQSGRPYRFQLHTTAAKLADGHTLIFAPTRGGKTVLIQHIIGGALRHRNMQVMAFDYFQGMRVFTEAVGGNYVDPIGKGVGFNPLQMEPTTENLSFLQRWLCQLAGVETMDRARTSEIAGALEALMAVPASDRMLSKGSTALGPDGSWLRKALSPWMSEGALLKNLVSAPRDTFAVGPGLTTIDLTALRENGEASAALMRYAMHRLRVAAGNGTPHMLVLDELLASLDNPIFREDVIEVGVRQAAKLRGVLVAIIQDFPALLQDKYRSVWSAMNSNARTRIIFPNRKLTEDHCRELGLSQDESAFVRNPGQHPPTKHMKRPFLFIRGDDERVILDSDLRWMGRTLRLYEGGPANARRLDALRQKYGDEWINPYLHTDEDMQYD